MSLGSLARSSAEGLVNLKELYGPSLWFVLGPKEGSNGHGGREVRDEVPGHTGTLGISIQISIPEGGHKKGAVGVDGQTLHGGPLPEFSDDIASRVRGAACSGW